jgi:alpha-tubulin suppressor-like RCC1 family protein
MTDNTLWCWGRGRFEGDDNYNSATPVQVDSSTDWTDISVTEGHNCGRRDDATIWCWGSNTWGALGDGSMIDSHFEPVEVESDLGWNQVSAGTTHTCGIKEDDTLWCWGRNINDKLGYEIDEEYVPGRWALILIGCRSQPVLGIPVRSGPTTHCGAGDCI